MMRYRRRIRTEVRQELTDHFTDALAQCENESHRNDLAQELINKFRDARLLAKLIRRGKKRCRPLWKKMMIRASRIFGCLILSVILRGAYIGLGQPTEQINYLEWLTEQSRQGRDESQNAHPEIVKAIEVFAKPDGNIHAIFDIWPGEMTPEELNLTNDFLSRNQAALEQLRKATEKPCYWVNYADEMAEWRENTEQSQWGNMSYAIEKVLSDTRHYRPLAKTIRLASAMAAHQGYRREALSDCITLQKFAQFLGGHGLLIAAIAWKRT